MRVFINALLRFSFATALLAVSAFAVAAECPLCDAVSEGNLTEVKQLLEQGWNPNAARDDGTMALMRAANLGNIEAAKMLLDAGADVDAMNMYGMTSLMLAAEVGRANMTRFLIQSGADVNLANAGGWTALDIAEEIGNRGIVRILRDEKQHKKYLLIAFGLGGILLLNVAIWFYVLRQRKNRKARARE